MSLSNLRDAVQTAFYAGIGIVTVLTYLRAKKTLLQPLRTEIFKAQLQEFSQILGLFSGKGEYQLRQEWGLDFLITANVAAMFDQFAWTFFDLETDPDKRPYNFENCPRSILDPRHVQLADQPFEPDTDKPKGSDRDPRVRAALWNKYVHDHIRLPRKLIEAEARLDRVLESPLLPKTCILLLQEFRATVGKNIDLIKQCLTEAAGEMPEKYPSIAALQKSSALWINNRYNEKFEQLKPKADAIGEFIRNYYDVESIFSD